MIDYLTTCRKLVGLMWMMPPHQQADFVQKSGCRAFKRAHQMETFHLYTCWLICMLDQSLQSRVTYIYIMSSSFFFRRFWDRSVLICFGCFGSFGSSEYLFSSISKGSPSFQVFYTLWENCEIAANMLFDQQISTNKPEELEALSSEMSPAQDW